jgi:DNA (cytosine-5)-methyltransferase 1
MQEAQVPHKKRPRRPPVTIAPRTGPRFGEDRPANSFSVVSYFAGCGGLDLGFLGGFTSHHEYFRRLPFHILAAYDHDPLCVDTYRRNIGDEASCLDLGATRLPPIPKAQVLIGGFPCQDFSSCGPKRGLQSSRGRLYRAMIDYMTTNKPAIVIGENVPHIAKIHGGEVMQTILSDIGHAGYDCVVWRLFAPQYGVPQNRERLFFVCIPQNAASSHRPAEPTPQHKQAEFRSIDWAIKDLIAIDDEKVPNQSQFFVATKAKRGNGQGDETSRSGYPAYTVRANAKSRVQFHYSLPRRLTVRECARLQTFPDDFVFPHSATTNIMQIGNAVPPVLAYYVAQSVLTYLKKTRMQETYNAKDN